ncbi:ankyrin repeat domain-containing protein [Pseudozyma hubeiensis SY62]|uniref:Ankyrin repeat domain-containing protein n=1 Tax=Pseudozyma hubeiensis (strain SY62) TaxID=1305764 RepID=R9P6Z7_PSEHS|nr:ankyrin repeat domain-containing protein [Pseudozyma hubeiensis SY62]GAC93840.1 ankyrin repeat domain-containing protein [Pseudozyma hubeiensis SY62]
MLLNPRLLIRVQDLLCATPVLTRIRCAFARRARGLHLMVAPARVTSCGGGRVIVSAGDDVVQTFAPPIQPSQYGHSYCNGDSDEGHVKRWSGHGLWVVSDPVHLTLNVHEQGDIDRKRNQRQQGRHTVHHHRRCPDDLLRDRQPNQSDQCGDKRDDVNCQPARPGGSDGDAVPSSSAGVVRVDAERSAVTVRVFEAGKVRSAVERGAVTPSTELQTANRSFSIGTVGEIDNSIQSTGSDEIERRRIGQRRGRGNGDEHEQDHRNRRERECWDEVFLRHVENECGY